MGLLLITYNMITAAKKETLCCNRLQQTKVTQVAQGNYVCRLVFNLGPFYINIYDKVDETPFSSGSE